MAIFSSIRSYETDGFSLNLRICWPSWAGVLVFFLLGPSIIFAQNPESIANLEIWLRSDAEITLEEGKVASWGNLHNTEQAVNADANRRPTLEEMVFTSQNGVTIGGGQFGPFLEIALNNGSGSFTVYSLIRTADFSNAVQYFLGFSPGTRGFGVVNSTQRLVYFEGGIQAQILPPLVAESVYLLKATYDSDLNILNLDLNFGEWTAQASGLDIATIENLRIGTRSDLNWSFNGDLGEILLFSALLTETDQETMEAYFYDYYAPPIGLPSEIVLSSFCDTTLTVSDRYKQVEWSTGSTSNATVIDSPGTVLVSAITIFGDTLQKEISIEYPGFYPDDFTLCQGSDSLWMIGVEDLTVTWQDGSQALGYLISEEGLFYFSAVDGEGCTYASDTVQVTLDTFSATSLLPESVELCAGGVLETGLTELENLNFEWSSGANEEQIVIDESGEYWVQITNANGCVATDTTTVSVLGINPQVGFSFTRNCESGDFEFIDESVPNGSDLISEWLWQFETGVTSNEPNPAHDFSGPGQFEVTLSIFTEDGCFGEQSQEVIVPSEITADLILSNNCVGYETLLNDESTVLFDDVQSIDWMLMNSVGEQIFSATGEFINFTFPETGLYTVVRLFERSDGCIDSLSTEIEILSSSFCFQPSEISSLNFWLDADSLIEFQNTGTQVLSWGNRVDSFHDAISPAVSNSPIYIEEIPQLNSHSVLRFDGENDFMDYEELNNIRTIVMVYKHRTGIQTGLATILGHPDENFLVGGQNDLLLLPTAIHPFVSGGSTRVNGVETPPSALVKPEEYTIFSLRATGDLMLQYITNDRNVAGRYWDGDYTEILYFNDYVEEQELLQTEQYLRYKFAPPVNLPEKIEVEYGFCPFELSVSQAYYENYAWNTGDEVGVIEVSTPGMYVVTVTDLFGYQSTDSVQVIYPGQYLSADTVICVGDTLVLNTELSEEHYSFEWSSGEAISSILVDEAGTYFVTVTDTSGCSYTSETIEVLIDYFSEMAEILAPENFCEGNALELNVSADQVSSYLWSTGSVAPAIIPDEETTYGLSAINNNGCVLIDSVAIEFNGIAPVTAFALSQPCAQTEVILSNESTTLDGSELTSEEWLVNGVLVSGENPPFTFPQYGNYLVELTVLTSANCTGITRDSIFIHPLPEVGFEYSLPCSGQLVTFEDSSNIALGSIDEWLWNFENVSFVNSPQTQYTFSSPGVGMMSLTVVSDQGCTAVLEANLPVNPTPQASFNWSPTCEGAQMPFESTTDTSLTGSLNYAWNFDGVVASGINPEHLFPDAGDYTVTHEAWTTINNLPGCFGQSSQIVTVSPQPQLDYEHTVACAGDVFTLNDATLPGQGDSVLVWQWFFNGEVIDTTDSFVFTIPNPGEYPVVLAIETEAGCSGQLSQTIAVGSTEPPSFALSPEVAGPPAMVQFTNLGSYGASHLWDFGDGNTSLEIDPVHTYQDTGIFVPQLIVVDEAGCTGIVEGEFYAFDPYFDVSIESVETTIQSGQVVVNGVLGNYNNHRLTSAVLRMWLGNGTIVSELWEGNLDRNQLSSFTMNAQLNFSEEINASYLCVEIDLPNGFNLDAVPVNNRKCVSLSTQAFEMFSPFPNPAEIGFQQFFHLGRNGEVNFRLVQSDGKVVLERTQKHDSGLNSAWFDTRSLAGGIYVLWAEFNGETAFKRIQIIR